MASALTKQTAEVSVEGEHKPYVAASAELPEITLKAVILGIVLAVVLGAANAYVGLRVGLTVSASIPAAVISMGVLRFFRNNNILENNIVQTMTASGPALAAGVIFTVPAALILQRLPGNEAIAITWWQTTLIALVGGVLGVLFTIPLRRAFIVDAKLPFPEGVACAEVLKVGEKGGAGVKYLTGAILLGAAYNFSQLGMSLWAETLQGARRIGNVPVYLGSVLEPILMGVGYIVGMRVGLYLVLGGAIAWFALIPLFLTTGIPGIAAPMPWPTAGGAELSALDAAFQVWNTKIRLVGGGAMITGGLYALYKTRKSLAKAMKEGLSGVRAAGGKDTRVRTERDMNLGLVSIAIGVLAIPMFFVFSMFTGSYLVAAAATVVMLIAGFFFSSVAGYMAGMVGSSNNPISGVTIVTLIFSSVLLLAFGMSGPAGILGALAIGAVVCCAAAIGGDNLQDLKTGYLVGSTPWKQQVAQMTGAIAFAATAGGVVFLLDSAFGIADPTRPDTLLAPQATLMSNILNGIFGGQLDWGLIGLGAAIGLVLMLFQLPVMAVAIGMYLPLSTTLPILIGGLLNEGVMRYTTRTLKDTPAEEKRELTEAVDQNGLLFASGLIAGGALMGILLAALIVANAPIGLYAPLVFGILAAAGFALLGERLGVWRWVGAGATFLAGVAWTYALVSGGGAYSFASEAEWPGFLIFAYIAVLMVYLPLRALLVRGGPTDGK